MDKKEFALFSAALKTYYPREQLLPNNQAMELWYNQLKDIPYKVAEIALNKWVATNKWSPAISEIREMAATLTQGEVPDWGEAWEQVIKAIACYGMYRPDEAMESFDDITRQCVKRLGFRNICLSENINTDRANFRQIYQAEAERKKQQVVISDAMKQAIASISGTLALTEGE